MRRRIIILLNIIFIMLGLYFLYTEYQRVGQFQWVDPGAVEDQEELYTVPITVASILLGLISLFYHIRTGQSANRSLFFIRLSRFVLRPLTFLYAVYAMVFGVVLFVLFSGAIVDVSFYNVKELLAFFLLLLCVIGYITMGTLTLIQLNRENN